MKNESSSLRSEKNGSGEVESKEAKRLLRFWLSRMARSLFACGVLLGLACGCATPERMARRIATAPNVQHPPSADVTDHWVQALCAGKDPFKYFNVPVGPPEATLALMELPPADYHAELVSSVRSRPNGRSDFEFKMSRKVPGTTSPVPERGTIFVLHGYGSRKEVMIPWAFVLAKAGYRVVLPDVRGHGCSTGQTFTCGKQEAVDLMQALDYLRTKPGHQGEVGVLGLSFGADLALQWAARDARVGTVVAIAPYNHPDEALIRFARAIRVPVGAGTLREAMRLAGARLDLNWSELSGEFAARRLARPVLFIGGGKDAISPSGDLETLEQAAPAGSCRIMIPEADHFAVAFCFYRIQAPVTDWFEEHLSAPAGAAATPNGSAEESVVGSHRADDERSR
jgi:pimeloyl-ACP methyl ester carboxylesterase